MYEKCGIVFKSGLEVGSFDYVGDQAFSGGSDSEAHYAGGKPILPRPLLWSSCQVIRDKEDSWLAGVKHRRCGIAREPGVTAREMDKRPASKPTRRGRRQRGGARERWPSRQVPQQAGRGGLYRPLGPRDLQRLDRVVLDILATVGLAEALPEAIALVTERGGSLDPDGRLLFPVDLVRSALKVSKRPLVLHGRRPELALTLEGKRVHMGTGGAAPFIVDPDSGRYRPSTLQDLYDAARLVDRLEHVRFFSRSLVARDIADPFEMDVNTAFASLAGTAKHVMVSAASPEAVRTIAELCFLLAGSPEAFRERPFLSLNVNHVVPPLRFSPEACAVLLEAVRLGIPAHVNTFGQLGASSPVTVAGSVAQTIAETLAGLLVAWLANPEAKVVFGARPMVTDLRSGAMSGGGGEQAVLTAASVQMAQFYGLPNSTIAGASDAKIADAQSGYEKCLSVTLAAQTGCNLITQACGMQAGLMGCSLESYAIDNEMLGTIQRSLAPVEVSDATLSAAMIGEVVRGEGHFLGHEETLNRMESDFLYPRLADRRSPEEWDAAGAPDIRQAAKAFVRQVLAQHYPEHLRPEQAATLRRRFAIHLPAEAMRPK